MASHLDYESPFEETITKENVELCPYSNEAYAKYYKLYLSCDCKKKVKEESHDDYYIPMSSPSAAVCDNSTCPKRGTSRCMFCDKVYCENCVVDHFIIKQHKLLYKMPYPAKEKKTFPCYNKCKKDEKNTHPELAQIYCICSRAFTCLSCKGNLPKSNYRVITYVGNEMKLVRDTNKELKGINDNDQDEPNNPTESNDLDRVPIPKSTRFSDYIPATTPNNEKVLIKNRGKFYPPPLAAAKVCDPIIVCECCGRKAEESVKCNYCKKSYHRRCHLPPLPEKSTDDAPMIKWKCTMCLNINKLKPVKTLSQNTSNDIETCDRFSLAWIEKKIAQRILMELYCRSYDSQHYVERPARLKNHHYYEIIKRPVSLNDVRNRLNSDGYSLFGSFVKDLKQVYKNGLLYYCAGDRRLNAANNLRIMLNEMLDKWVPILQQSDENGWKLKYRF